MMVTLNRFGLSPTWWLVILFPPLLVLALWLCLWWQWTLPSEDFDVLPSLVVLCGGSAWLGLLAAKDGWTRRTWVACGLGLLLCLPSLVVWAGAFPVLVPLGAGCHLLARRLARGGRAWRGPLLVSLTPLLLVAATQQPIYSDYKWLWPWISFRHEILELQTAADAAADRLGLPKDRNLTQQELDRWSSQIEFQRDFKMPIIGKTVYARVVLGRGRDAQPVAIWAWWGGPGRRTFGPLDVRTMHILSASD